MTIPASVVADCVTGYAARLHAAIGARHNVASPLGAWLLLALAAPAASGADRDELTEILGCDADTAARAAAALLAAPHPLVASAAAVWTAPKFEGTRGFQHWLAGLPGAVTTGDLPAQRDLDRWARDHTFGLIERFPVGTAEACLVLASALATKVSWEQPFQLAPAASLGGASPWARSVSQVLRTPARASLGHQQFIASTPAAGDVIVHMARAAGNLVVVSVAALSGVPADRVLAVAHDLGRKLVVGAPITRRGLADLPVGAGPLWTIREVTAESDSCVAVLPAWSASSRHGLSDRMLGFAAAKRSLVPGSFPWDAQQAAMARYTRTGFEAAAATAFAVAMGMRTPGPCREAELRFGHPYAVVALTTDSEADGRPHQELSAWHGLPVFSAWVTEPDDAADDAPAEDADGDRGSPV